MRSEPLPSTDPAYPEMLDVLSRHGGTRIVAGPETHDLLCDLLEVVVEDRVRHAGPPDIDQFFDSLTAEQHAELVDPDADGAPPVVIARSGVSPTGVYTAVIEYGPDIVRSLTPTEAQAYIDAMLNAVWQAEYDAAALNQLRNAGPQELRNEQAIADVLISLRKSRVAVDQKPLKPLIVRASISTKTGKPYLTVRIAGTKAKWRWMPADGIQHAVQVHSVMVTADLDAAYRRLLVGEIGVTDSHARQMVSDLGQWRF